MSNRLPKRTRQDAFELFRLYAESYAREQLQPSDDWPPTLLVEMEDGEAGLYPLPHQFMGSPDEREFLFRVMVPKLLKEFRALRAGLLVTIWYIAGTKEDAKDQDSIRKFVERSEATGGVKNNPLRTEGVQFLLADHAGAEQRLYRIRRTEGDPPSLWDDPIDYPESPIIQGRMIDGLKAGLV